jgi:DNA transformation protein
MPVSEEYIEYILDQLDDMGEINVIRMFGGAGLYLDGIFFAIVADDTLYFKVDDSNKPDYLAAGMQKFHTLRYYEVPPDVLEDSETVKEWAERAVAVAIRKQEEKKRKKKKR